MENFSLPVLNASVPGSRMMRIIFGRVLQDANLDRVISSMDFEPGSIFRIFAKKFDLSSMSELFFCDS